MQENVSTQRVRLALTATGIEGVTPPDVKLKAIPVTIQFNIPPQPTVSQVAKNQHVVTIRDILTTTNLSLSKLVIELKTKEKLMII